MDFFSKLGSKISDTTKDVTQKTKDAVEISKLKSQIASEENRIQAAYSTIGKKYFEQSVGEVSDDFVNDFNAINDAKAKIAQLNAEIAAIKGTYNCPNCGAEVQLSAAFCAVCGTKVEPPVKKEKAEEPVVEEAAAETVVESDENKEQ